MKPGVVALGEFGGHRRRSVAGFDVADVRVFAGRDVFAPLGFGGGLGGLDARRVLAMRRDQGGGVTEDAFQSGGGVDQHVTRRRTHEDLNAADFSGIDAFDDIQIGVGRTEEEGVVGDRGGRTDGILLFELFERRRGWVRIRHLHERRHAAGQGRAGLAGDAGLVGQARLAEVYLVVDQSR